MKTSETYYAWFIPSTGDYVCPMMVAVDDPAFACRFRTEDEAELFASYHVDLRVSSSGFNTHMKVTVPSGDWELRRVTLSIRVEDA